MNSNANHLRVTRNLFNNLFFRRKETMSTTKREMTLRFLAPPAAANFGGKIHGGSAMKWLDEAGYACAAAWSGKYCVTAFVGDINFHYPILVGDLVEINAKIIHTGRSSMHIFMHLGAGDPKKGELSKSMHCMMVFVAVDEKGKTVEVPAWDAVSESDVSLENYAIRIKEWRKINEKELNSLIEE